MSVNLDEIELLSKGLRYKAQIDELSTKKFKLMMTIFSLIALIGLIISIVVLDSFGLTIASLVYMAGILVSPKYYKKNRENKIIKIEENTVKFERYRTPGQIISKTQESNTTVSVNQNQYGSTINKTTNYKYIVGLRTPKGDIMTVYSKELFLGSREGEYVDIVSKYKIDKNNKIIDFIDIPLMETVRNAW